MDRWSLKDLYHGYDSEEFLQDYEHFKEMIEKIQEAALNLNRKSGKDELMNILTLLESFQVAWAKLKYFVELSKSVDTTDPTSTAYYGKLGLMYSSASKAMTQIYKFISTLDIDELIREDEFLSEYEFFLHEIKEKSSHMLSDEAEEVMAMYDLSGGNAWESLQEYLSSTVEVDFNGKTVTLSHIRNLAYSDDAHIRKRSYEAELASYKKIEDSVAFSLNNIKRQVNTESRLRGYDSPLDMTLHDSRMSRSTLDALISAIDKHMPKFRKYMKHKANILGYQHGLPWFELFAPMGKTSKEFTVQDAKIYLVDHFRKFSDDLADMVIQAFDEDWIDFFPRKGKVGGAFCENLPFIKQSRILTNFNGTLSDVITLAHELGHAYHGLHIQDHRPLNTDYSMPVAETASTFNENLIMNAALAESKDSEETLFLIESQLQDLNQIICDIYSRFLFEKSVFEGTEHQFLFPKDLERLMLNAQDQSYGDGLDPNYRHPFMWICKSHYYSSEISYYNFPYAFGGLFARGLYAKYEKEGKDFIPKYQQLLHATTVSSVEDVAKLCDIDLTTDKFWDDAFTSCGELIDQFITLTSQS
ncbi:MAG TPA: M3 family oligoendopeptidase [Candidatus Merdenecus merdavium]|nr:M3 family oligoendopeptidase [Candidatus Merdenecus merdavium]